MTQELTVVADADLARALVFETPVAKLPDLIRRLDIVKAEAMARGLPDIAKRASDAAHLCRLRVVEAVPARESGYQGHQSSVPAGDTTPEIATSTLRTWRSTYAGHTLDSLEERLAKSDEPVTREALAPKKSPPHVTNNSGDNEWYTPAPIVDAARAIMGTIDLDPASSAKANEVVKATHYYTPEYDAFRPGPWRGNLWMNPPYESGLVVAFVDRLIIEVRLYPRPAIVLVNNATETKWGQDLLAEAVVVCFPSGRIRFEKSDGVRNTPLQGQMIVGLGTVDIERFIQEYKEIGTCLVAQ